mgnify:FL=1
MRESVFPRDFLWGAATASAQIEGGWNEDGRTPSIWDVAPENKIHNGENCHTSCDHYHRFREDVAIMKELGLKSYRFSLSWSRIIPEEGKVNEKGIAFYNALIDELLGAGIEPLITLYHWDLPVWMDKKGGWKTLEIRERFLEYAAVVVDAFSDRVKYWITFNEPQCFLMNGYMQGIHAPFQRDYLCFPKISRNFMLTNAATVKLIREKAKTPPKVGLAFAAGAFIPKNEKDLDSVEQARKKSFYKGMGTMNNRWWMDPILLGKPVQAYGIYHSRKRDMKDIQVKLDFIGINNYSAFNYSDWGGDKKVDTTNLPKNSLGWVIDGRSMYWTVRFLYERYGVPIMITENGMSNRDAVNEDGEICDDIRIGYLDEYLRNLKQAIAEGVPVIGYQHWSLMDNFEWAEGYDPRFGLVYVDFKIGNRTIKKSGYHYKQIIESNGTTL